MLNAEHEWLGESGTSSVCKVQRQGAQRGRRTVRVAVGRDTTARFPSETGGHLLCVFVRLPAGEAHLGGPHYKDRVQVMQPTQAKNNRKTLDSLFFVSSLKQQTDKQTIVLPKG